MIINKQKQNIDINRIEQLNKELGIDINAQYERKLQMYPEERGCVPAGLDYMNREVKLHPLALEAWLAMKQSAIGHNINITICSAFRSYSYQTELIKRKLSAGQQIQSIISVIAPPGFSEHHTGRAIDIITDGITSLDESFEQTEAFRWLTLHANKFNFYLSYPRNNPFGVIYEPWHWCYKKI